MSSPPQEPAVHERWRVGVKRPNERRSLSRSATRALDVMELFGQARVPLRAIEIAKALELHPSTANQLLKTMVESAHLTFDADMKTYVPSPRLAPFSEWMMATYGADKELRNLVRHAHAATGEVVTLSTPNGIYMQILEQASDPSLPVETATERGLRVSMFGTAIGAAHLSTLQRAEVSRMIERARIPPGDAAALASELAEVRRQGVAEGASMNGSFWAFAVALPRGGFPAPLVLGISGPMERTRAKAAEIRALMLDAVQRRQARPG